MFVHRIHFCHHICLKERLLLLFVLLLFIISFIDQVLGCAELYTCNLMTFFSVMGINIIGFILCPSNIHCLSFV
jgi:hypothetical protein